MVRVGFTIIELVFSIVIISISVMALPTLINTTNKAIEDSLIQEAIFSASAELMGATVGYWDENSMQDMNKSTLSRVINIQHDCSEDTKLRYGHIDQPYHRRCLDNLQTTPRSSAGGIVYDIDDASYQNKNIFIDQTTQASGYKKHYTSSINVTQEDDVKTIKITIKDENNNTIVKLKSVVANIGEVDYFKRTMY
jgi:type II secretory pathway pseudopilin PulG